MPSIANISKSELLTISFTLFAVIDILGSIPVLISLKDKMGGQIRSFQATIASGTLMILFLFLGRTIPKLVGPGCTFLCGSGKHCNIYHRSGNGFRG